MTDSSASILRYLPGLPSSSGRSENLHKVAEVHAFALHPLIPYDMRTNDETLSEQLPTVAAFRTSSRIARGLVVPPPGSTRCRQPVSGFCCSAVPLRHPDMQGCRRLAHSL